MSAFFCSLIFLFSACFQSNQTQTETEIPAVEIPASQINLDEPLVISEKAEDVALAKRIDEIIAQSEFRNARWGVFVVSLKDGRVLVAREAQKLFNPASAQKILTSVVALDKLGADFRWKTSVYGKNEITDGILDGDLTLYGNGAPDFDAEGVGRLVAQIKAKGLREVKGDIVGDESFFKGDKLGDGWTWNEIQWYYGAEASALSVNRNLAKITLQNGKPNSSSDFVEVSGETKPVEDIEAVGVKRELAQNKVYVWGNGNNLNARIAVENPALWSAEILKRELEKNGIKISGRAKSADWKSSEKLNVESAFELASVESANLAEIVRRMNKDSVNLSAELILRILGKKFGETAPDENPQTQKLRGDDSAGASVIKKWLTDNKIASSEIKIHDGSGLSRLDFVTPESIGRALIFAAQSKFAGEFNNSLPVAGTDGTLRGRLGNASGKIIAKTGSIKYVGSLAGFAKTKDETLAFVIFCNNATGKSDYSLVIDQIATSLLDTKQIN